MFLAEYKYSNIWEVYEKSLQDKTENAELLKVLEEEKDKCV